MDIIDKKILAILQEDTTLPLSAIAKKVDLSTTPCFNRIKKLEEDGVIKKRVAILDNNKINLPIIVFLSISVAQHDKEWLQKFVDRITSFEEVAEMYRLSGDTDYIVKVLTNSIEEYDKFNQQLINEIDFRSLKSNIVLKEIKNNTTLPLKHIG